MNIPATPQFRAAVNAESMKRMGVNARLEVKSFRRNMSVIFGSGGNIAVLPGAEGQLAIDSGFLASEEEIKQALAGISNDPLRHLVNTHFHFDHADGNEWMHKAGATIIAHENTRRRMAIEQTIPEFDCRLPPSSAAALPAITFEEKLTLDLNGETVRVKHYSSAGHTDTDVSVYFERADLLHTGDTWMNNGYPFIDYTGGGSINGYIAQMEENIALAGPDTIVLSGHGPAGNRDDLIRFHDMLTEIRARVRNAKALGASINEVIDSRPSARWDAKWGGGVIPPELFIWLIYRGI